MGELGQEKLSALLKFCTGSPTVPIEGFRYIICSTGERKEGRRREGRGRKEEVVWGGVGGRGENREEGRKEEGE